MRVWCSNGGVVGFFCCWFTMDLWVVVGGGNGGVCGTTVVGWWRCWTLFVVGVSYRICGLTGGSGVCGVAMVGWWVWQQWLLGWNFWCYGSGSLGGGRERERERERE